MTPAAILAGSQTFTENVERALTCGGPSGETHDSCLLRENHQLSWCLPIHESDLVLRVLSLQWFVHRHIDVTTQSLTILVAHTEIHQSWQVHFEDGDGGGVIGEDFVDVTHTIHVWYIYLHLP